MFKISINLSWSWEIQPFGHYRKVDNTENGHNVSCTFVTVVRWLHCPLHQLYYISVKKGIIFQVQPKKHLETYHLCISWWDMKASGATLTFWSKKIIRKVYLVISTLLWKLYCSSVEKQEIYSAWKNISWKWLTM